MTLRINDEAQLLSPPIDYETIKRNYIIPIQAPFYMEDVVLEITPVRVGFSNYPIGVKKQLTYGKDYVGVLEFKTGSLNSGKAVFGGILFTDPDLAGDVEISYTSVDEAWTIDSAARLAILQNNELNPVVTSWEEASGKGEDFPIVKFTYDYVNFKSLSSISDNVDLLFSELNGENESNSIFNFNTHITNYNNPHVVTKEQLGLGLVPNWPLVTLFNARRGVGSSFLTPVRTYDLITYGMVVPKYSNDVLGITRLNNGFSGGDLNREYAVTTHGLIYYKTSLVANAINTFFDNERQQVFFSPTPVVFPVRLLTKDCYNFKDLLIAVEDRLKLKPIQGSKSLWCVWLPPNVNPPTLTCTPI